MTGRLAVLSAQLTYKTYLITPICVITIWVLMMLIPRLFQSVLTPEIAAARYLPGMTLSSNGNSSRFMLVTTWTAVFTKNVQLQAISRVISLLRCRLPILQLMSLIWQATARFSGTIVQSRSTAPPGHGLVWVRLTPQSHPLQPLMQNLMPPKISVLTGLAD